MCARSYLALALDLGAESGRAVLGQFDGELLVCSEVHRFANQPVQLPGALHWDILPINTLYQLLALREAHSPLLEAARTLLTIPDLLAYWLSGTAACEFTNATTTQCYDPRAHAWATPLLDALGLPSRVFPPVVEPGTTLGQLKSAHGAGDRARRSQRCG
jgi:sugar (pentulose or hexulose) kinase